MTSVDEFNLNVTNKIFLATVGELVGGAGTTFVNNVVFNGTASGRVIATDGATLDSHVASSTAHGATGAVMGTTNTQTVTNKTLDDGTTLFQNTATPSKKLAFSLTGITTGATRTLTIPDASTTIVGTDVAQTLTNKTLTSPTISTIVNTGTLTLPTSTDTIVGRATTDTLTNKSLNNTSVFHTDNADPTKKIGFQSSGATTATTLTIASLQTTSQTLNLPNITATDTLVTATSVQTLTNKTLTSPTISTIVNTGTLTLPTSTDTIVGRATTDTLTNKSLNNTSVFHTDNADPTKKIGYQSSGATTATVLTIAETQSTSQTLSIPNITGADILQTLGLAQTITGVKTFSTAPVISTITNTGTLTLPTSTDTIVGRATTDTLTNKNLTGTTNVIRASQLGTTGADVVVNTAAPPTTGQVLTATSATAAAWSANVSSINVVTLTANGTITAGFAVMLDTTTDNRVILATGALGDRVIGVAQNSATAGQSVSVQTAGLINVQIVQTGAIVIARGDKVEISYVTAGAGTVNRAINGENVTGPAFARITVAPTYGALNQCLLLPQADWATAV